MTKNPRRNPWQYDEAVITATNRYHYSYADRLAIYEVELTDAKREGYLPQLRDLMSDLATLAYHRVGEADYSLDLTDLLKNRRAGRRPICIHLARRDY